MCMIIYYNIITGKIFFCTNKDLYLLNTQNIMNLEHSYYINFESILITKKSIETFKKTHKLSYYLFKPISRFYPKKKSELNSDEIENIINNEKCFNHFYTFNDINMSYIYNYGNEHNYITILNYVLNYSKRENNIFSILNEELLNIIFKKVSKNLIYIKKNILILSDEPKYWLNY